MWSNIKIIQLDMAIVIAIYWLELLTRHLYKHSFIYLLDLLSYCILYIKSCCLPMFTINCCSYQGIRSTSVSTHGPGSTDTRRTLTSGTILNSHVR